jgi:hypothetical protein
VPPRGSSPPELVPRVRAPPPDLSPPPDRSPPRCPLRPDCPDSPAVERVSPPPPDDKTLPPLLGAGAGAAGADSRGVAVPIEPPSGAVRWANRLTGAANANRTRAVNIGTARPEVLLRKPAAEFLRVIAVLLLMKKQPRCHLGRHYLRQIPTIASPSGDCCPSVRAWRVPFS